ncbi:MAG: hypothetical protein AAF251_03815 [Pseudomonadota bacterium]
MERRLNTGFRLAIVAFCAGALIARPAQAEGDETKDLAILLPADELGELRGGFVVSGMTVHFGADIRTYVDGELLLQTVINLGPDGAETVQKAAAGLSPVDVASLENGVLSNGNIRMRVGDTPVYLINDGQTAIVHETTNGVQNTLVNTAVGLEAVQQVDASLTLSGYENFSADLLRDRLDSSLNDLAGQAGISALGN